MILIGKGTHDNRKGIHNIDRKGDHDTDRKGSMILTGRGIYDTDKRKTLLVMKIHAIDRKGKQ